ncbi:MAG: sugar transferase [Candidatus Omnitrophica bacterium]|nr:sugar transferase [Candidatus Omnitrophota bacterium]
MLKQHATIFRRLKMLCDAFLIIAAFFLAYRVREQSGEPIWALKEMLWVIPIQIGLWLSSLYLFNMYTSFRLKGIPHIILIIIKSCLLSIFLFGSVIYLFRLTHVSRVFVLLSFFYASLLILSEKVVVLSLLRNLRRKGFNFREIMVVGTGPRARRFINQIDKHREFGLNIKGLIDADPDKVGEKFAGYPVIGTLKDIPEILRNNAINHIFYIVPHSWLKQIEESVLYCETVGVRVSVAVDHFNLTVARAHVEEFLGVPMIRLESTPDRAWDLMLKRLVDVVLSLGAVLLLLPLFILCAIIIKVTSPGPIFFIQERSGVNGRRFRLYKLRTMGVGAESELDNLKKYNEMQGPVFKMKNDPRVTFFGKWLRKLSIDELPQLWNVMKGDMSLVGPRPPIPTEVEQYDHWQRRRLSMRPGLTCVWQIKGRNKIVDFDEWMQMDLQYIDNWSLGLDAKIIMKTVPVVLFGIGAK